MLFREQIIELILPTLPGYTRSEDSITLFSILGITPEQFFLRSILSSESKVALEVIIAEFFGGPLQDNGASFKDIVMVCNFSGKVERLFYQDN